MGRTSTVSNADDLGYPDRRLCNRRDSCWESSRPDTAGLNRLSADAVRCSNTNLSLDHSHDHLSPRQHPPHRQQSPVPAPLWLHTRRTSNQEPVAGNLLHDRNDRKPQLCSTGRCQQCIDRGSELVLLGLCCRRFWSGLRNNGNGCRPQSGPFANLPSRSEHIRWRWYPRAPWRACCGTHLEKILVAGRKVLPRNMILPARSNKYWIALRSSGSIQMEV